MVEQPIGSLFTEREIAMNLKRTAFGVILAITVGVWMVAVATRPVAAAELKLAHFMPTVHTLHQEVFLPLAQDLSDATEGVLTIKIYPSGALGKGPVQQYKRAVTGVADITFIIQSYSSAVFPRSLIATQPGVTLSAEQGTRRLWDVYDLYLKDTQPVIVGASYRYLVVRFDDLGEIVQIIPLEVLDTF